MVTWGIVKYINNSFPIISWHKVGGRKIKTLNNNFFIFLLQVMLKINLMSIGIQDYTLYSNCERCIIGSCEWSAILGIMPVVLE